MKHNEMIRERINYYKISIAAMKDALQQMKDKHLRDVLHFENELERTERELQDWIALKEKLNEG